MLSAIPLGIIFGTISVILQKQFKTEFRYSAVALTYNLAFASSGGFAAIICITLLTRFHTLFAPSWYLIGFSVVSLILYNIKKTTKR